VGLDRGDQVAAEQMVDVGREAELGFAEAEAARRRRNVAHRRHETVDAIARRVLLQVGIDAVEDRRYGRVERAFRLRARGSLRLALLHALLELLHALLETLHLVGGLRLRGAGRRGQRGGAPLLLRHVVLSETIAMTRLAARAHIAARGRREDPARGTAAP